MSTTNQQGGGNLRHALAHPADPRQPEDPDSIYVRACVAESDRASIVAFLAAEAKRLDEAAELYEGGSTSHLEILAKLGREGRERCRVKAGHTRALAAQIARSDDCLGGVK